MFIQFIKDHLYIVIGFIVSMVTALVINVMASFLFQVNQEDLIYEKQIESLNNVVTSIDTLRDFVIEQKNHLKKSQQSLAELKKQQEKLKPVVEADQKTIDAIFALQAEQNKKNIWWERAFGFFIGIASSLIATLIWAYNRKKA